MAALNPFRKQGSHKPLHSRWGDVTISAPTEGSWSQFDTSQRPSSSSHRKPGYGPGFVPDYSPRSRSRSRRQPPVDVDDETTASNHPMPPPRHNTFSISTLNPRRLSMRLAPRAKHTTHEHDALEEGQQQQQQQDAEGCHQYHAEPRAEFGYKPVRQDYPTEVASNHPHPHRHNHRSSRFRYIPASSRYLEELGSVPSRAGQLLSSRNNRPIDLDDRLHDSGYYDDENENDLCHDDYRTYSSSSSSSCSSSSYRSGHRYGVVDPKIRKFDPSVSGRTAGSGSVVSTPVGRERISSSRGVTMAMVPDAEDLYE